jgi:pyruvate/2-oxoglutarate dehydrogenase complex dihydrolipoamide acyltransferase (E2) component
MALTGQLSDMSLAELIEFFCNQRKTGRLKVDYHRGHGVFFIKDGELVDAKVGALSGAEAVYFALTLPNAAFDFSPEFQPSRRTIEDKWTQVVLEGLRRLDEGTSPTESDAFGGWTPSESDMAVFMDQVERLGETASKQAQAQGESAPLSMMVEGASSNGGKKKWMVAASVACVVLAVAVAAIPLSGRFSGKSSAPTATPTASTAPSSPAEASSAPSQEGAASETAAQVSTEASAGEAAGDAPVDEAAAQRWREEREREQRLREQRERERRQEEQARKADAEQPNAAAPNAATPVTPAAPSGPKSVRVQITYDESGRVTAASVAGSSPGAEAYAGTAVRVARGKRFPSGKAGTTIVTIPVN